MRRPALSTLLAGVAACLGILFVLPYEQWGLPGLWALDFLVYIPVALRIAMAALVAVAALPPVQQWLADLFQRVWIPPAWCVVALGGLTFVLFHERTLYGDGLRKLGLLSVDELATDLYTWKEPLDTLLVSLATRLVGEMGLGVQHAIAGLSVLAGMVYLAVVLGMARLLLQLRLRRVFFVAGMVALGSSQLWFGHIENYSLVTGAAYLTVLLALLHYRRKVSLWWVGLSAGAAISLHPQALFTLLPLVLLLERGRWPRQVAILAASGLLVPVITATVLLSTGTAPPSFTNGFAGDTQLFWRLDEALHPAQVGQALINLWLLVPALPVLLPLALGVGGWLRDWHARYFTILVTGLLLYHFSFQNDLPRAQDWDLYAIVGPGIMLFLLYILLNEDRTSGTAASDWPAIVRILWPALTFAGLFTAAWIGVNHTFRLLYPDPDLRPYYLFYRQADLMELLPMAQITPQEPLCEDVAGDPTGCRRVAPVTFTMPHDGDRRQALFAHAPAQVRFAIRLDHEPLFLWTSVALDPWSWNWGGDGVTFQVWAAHSGGQDLLWERHLSPDNPSDLDWQEVLVPLDGYREQEMDLLLVTTPGPHGDASADRAGWGFPWLMRGTIDRRIAQQP